MRSIAFERAGVIVGVDTHKDEHVAVALDGLGKHLGELHLDATNLGYAELLTWALTLGDVRVFAVEGCGSYGIGLARFLRRHGHTPVEVSRPPRAGERRLWARATRSTRNMPPVPSSPDRHCHTEARRWAGRSDQTRQDRP